LADLSVLDILLPAAFAGLVAIGATVAIERLGGRLGGLIATLPTTIIPASIGIAAEASSLDAVQAALYAVPAGMLLNVGFLWLWRAVPPALPAWSLRGRLSAMTLGSLGCWFVGAAAMVFVVGRVAALGTTALGVAAWLSTAAMVVVGVVACLSNPPAPKGTQRVGAFSLLLRGSLAGAAIGVAVAIAALGGGAAAGIASVFPAIFVTTMVSLWLAQGEAVPGGAVGPMMLGASAVAVHACVAAWSLPTLGPVTGTVLAWFTAVLGITLPAGIWLERLRR
jgi:hypothetical protein